MLSTCFQIYYTAIQERRKIAFLVAEHFLFHLKIYVHPRQVIIAVRTAGADYVRTFKQTDYNY